MNTPFADMPNDDFGAVVGVALAVHPFEAAGLGHAPFYCVNCRDAGEYGAATCQFCGHDIRYEYVIKDADGELFVVGSDCVAKTHAKIERFEYFDRKIKDLKSAAAKARKAEKTARTAAEYLKSHPAYADWIEARKATFGFAESMLRAINEYGSLTENQERAIDRCIVADQDRAARKAEAEHARAVTELHAPVADTTRLFKAFAAARESGLKYPKITMNGVTFAPAGSTSSNPGGLWVKKGRKFDDSVYLGKITPEGRYVRSSACLPEDETMILALVNDPEKAVTAYGKLTGNCAICNRELTDPESVARGIGPICAERFGW